MPQTTMTQRAWRLDAVAAHDTSSEMDEVAQLNSTAPTEPTCTSCGAGAQRQKSAGFVRNWNQVLRTWARVRLKSFSIQTVRFETVMHDLVAAIESTDSQAIVEKALLRQAQRLVPAYRVELTTETVSAHDDEPIAHLAGADSGQPASGARSPAHGGRCKDKSILELPLRCGSGRQGRLRIRPRARGVASLKKETIRRLTTLCRLGSCALERLNLNERWPEHETFSERIDECGAEQSEGIAPTGATFVNSTRLHDATFLNAVLPFAINQARRHNEPLSLVCVAIDRLHAIQDLLGRPSVDTLVESVGQTVASLIRASDIVARLDDDRIVAVLPRAPGGGALFVAQKICQSVADKSHDDGQMPAITVSIGVATFPSCADNVYSLFDAADEALTRAQSQGRNQAFLAPRRAAVAINGNFAANAAAASN